MPRATALSKPARSSASPRRATAARPCDEGVRRALARETGASLRGYAAASAQRAARARGAATAAARKGTGARVRPRTARRRRPAHAAGEAGRLRLVRAKRAALEARLAALSRRESAAVAALHAQDGAVLARYRGPAWTDRRRPQIAQMASQLRAKADANLARAVDVLHAARIGAGRSGPAGAPRKVRFELPARLRRRGDPQRL